VSTVRQVNGGSLGGSQTTLSPKPRSELEKAMMPENSHERWFALQVRTRWEGSTATLLSGKGYQTLLPTYKTKKLFRGKHKEISAPLFPGYVFCHFNAQNRLPVLVTPGVVGVVGSGRVPLPVEETEIEAIQMAISVGVPVEPWPYLEVGQRVRLESTAWAGLEGILINFKGSRRLVLSVSLLRRSVALEVDRSMVCPVPSGGNSFLDPLSAHGLLKRAIA
jgi:transcription antitermination factor NusG